MKPINLTVHLTVIMLLIFSSVIGDALASYQDDGIENVLLPHVATMRKLMYSGTPIYHPAFDEDADEQWNTLRTPPHVSFDDQSGSARVSCRTLKNWTQKRFYKILRQPFVYDAFVMDVETGKRALLRSSYTRENALEGATKALVDRLISTGQMKEPTPCLVPSYASPLILLQGSCPPRKGLKCDIICQFACSGPSYTLVGTSTIECMPNGSLSDAFPYCRAKGQQTTHISPTKGTYLTNLPHTTTSAPSTSSKKSPPIKKSSSTTERPSTTESLSPLENPCTTESLSATEGPSTSKSVPSTSTLPKALHRIKTFGFLSFLGVPFFLLLVIYAIYKSRNKQKYRVLDENAIEDDIDDVPPDVDGLYKRNHIKPAEPTDVQLDQNECYVMNQRNKGLVFILNNYIFSSDRVNERIGSDIDVANVRHVFTEIGYTPEEAQNLNAASIREKLRRVSQNVSASDTSVVLVFMSHGVQEGILGTDQKVVTVEEIKDMFCGNKCPALIGKPKIMIFQACRGDRATPSAPSQSVCDEDPGICTDYIGSEEARHHVGGAGDLDTDWPWSVPDNADMYIAHATSEGYFSLRHKQNGSWFIQALCEELIVRAHVDDLDTIMTKVTRRVKRLEARIMYHGRKQTTLQTPQVIKQGIEKMIYFLPKYPSLDHTEASQTPP